MIKKLMPFVAAGMILFSADAVMAQSSCSSKASSSECKKKCDGEKKSTTATSEFEFTSITIEQLSEMLGAGSVYVYDARSQESYDKGHIDGSILFANATLPADKNTPLVFYCGGPRCSAAPKAARAVLADGYTNVMVFTGGWLDWSNAAGNDQAGL